MTCPPQFLKHDVRLVLAYGRNPFATGRNGFGALDHWKVTGEWVGVEWRFSPHLAGNHTSPLPEARFKLGKNVEFFNSDLTFR